MDGAEAWCACEFLVPVTFNDGTPVPEEFLDRMFQALDRQFGGWQCTGRREGSWRGQREWLLAVIVAVPRSRVDELKRVIVTIGKELGQAQMYFDCREPSVELLDVDPPTTEPQN